MRLPTLRDRYVPTEFMLWCEDCQWEHGGMDRRSIHQQAARHIKETGHGVAVGSIRWTWPIELEDLRK